MKKQPKKKMNLSLHPDVIEKGEKLAQADRRSFSSLIEVLVIEKFAAMSPQKKAA